MSRLFKLKIERGIGEFGSDAAQMALLQTRDIQHGYEVVPGRQMVGDDVHRLWRDMNHDTGATMYFARPR
jgi:hypothetical protein